MPNSPLNGWLNLHKPLGMSSAKAVAIVKRHLKPSKIGHAGTLDPLASGVLPLALGEATKTVQFCMDHDKEYEFTVKWGEATTTCDSEGEITQTSPIIPTKEQILAAIPQFIGDIQQAPPQYSAIKINGVRAYDLARQGEVVEMKERVVRVHDLRLVDRESCTVSRDKEPRTTNHEPLSSFHLSCGKGTYVRSVARDIALKIGTFGHVTKLTRTKVGNFTLSNAILLEDIEKTVYKEAPSGVLLPVDTVLDDIQVLEFTPEEATRIKHGQKFLVRDLKNPPANFNDVFAVKSNAKLVAVCKLEGEVIKPLRVFNL